MAIGPLEYHKTPWTVADPITQEKMNNIEDGISENNTAVRTLWSQNLDSRITTQGQTITSLSSLVEETKGIAITASALSTDVAYSKGQIEAALIRENNTSGQPNYDDLAAHFHEIHDADSRLSTKISNIENAIRAAYNAGGSVIVNGSSRPSESLAETMAEHYSKIIEALDRSSSIYANLYPSGQRSIFDRLNAIDNNQTPGMTLINVITELQAARGDASNLTLDDRLDAMDTLISGKVNYSDVVDGLESNASNRPLSANQGRLIKLALGGNFDSTNTVNTAINAAETAAKAYTNAQNTANKVSEIISAHRNDVENDTLDNRFDDAEAAILQNASNISTINNNITTIATELGMVSNDEITGSSSRIDTIQSGLTTAVENIGTLQSRLATTTATANAAATQTDLTVLAGRVTTLEGKHETVVYDAPQSGSNYSEGIPNISNPSTDLNYLIQDNEGKYYYWRYFGAVTGWQLIGGAGEGGGTGTSSGVIVPQLPNAENANENTDYFVGNNEDGYLHYRFNEVNNELVPILIGVNFSDVKRYNMEKVILNEKPYLRLYEFKQGTENTILVDDSSTIADWVASTSYNIGDKVLYDGYYYECLQANNDSVWTNPNESKWKPLDKNMKVLTTIELPQGGGGGSTTGLNIRLVRIPPISSTVIKGNDVYIRFFYSAIDTEEGPRNGHYVLKNQNGIILTEGDIQSGVSSASTESWPIEKVDGQISEDGYGSINVKDYCLLGSNKFSLTITPENNSESRTREWTINTVELKLTSNAPQTQIVSTSEYIDINYIPHGGITNKELIVKIDGVKQPDLKATINGTGTELVCRIPPQSAGAHRIELALKATINGQEETSKESIIRDYIWYDTNSSVILSSPYRGQTITTTQYSEIEIPYSVYDANNLSPIVKYYYDYVNSSSTPFDEVTLSNTNEGVLKTTVNESGEHNVAIQVGDTILTFRLSIANLNITISPTPGAIIDFNPANYTNNSTHRLPTWQVGNNTYELTVSDNFNWSTKWTGDNQDTGGGYREDEDGKCFVIKAGTYATINYKMFKQNNTIQSNGGVSTTSAVFDDGAEMKIIFKVAAVRDASAIWFSNVGHTSTRSDDNTPIGIQLQAHEGWLKTDKASEVTEVIPAGYNAWNKTSAYNVGDVVVYKTIIYKCISAITAPAAGEENSWNKSLWQSLGQVETEISATNSYLYFPYSEEDKIELDININKQGKSEDFIMSYEDGVPSKAYPYSYSTQLAGDNLYHAIGEEADIIIGSPNCDVYIYRLRIYNKSLTTEQILRNFIADGKTIDERIARYKRNSIYYNGSMIDIPEEERFTPYASEGGILDPIKLAERMPNVKILMLDTPKFTVGKKDFVKGSTLRCIQATGGEVYPGTNADNWFFSNGYHAGQGTTSDNYGQSARNVDFLFECDGVHYPTKSSNLSDFTEGYQSFVAKGNGASTYNTNTQTWSIASEDVKELCINWKDDDTWISGKSYIIGDYVRYNKQVYKCKADHTSDSSFDATKWDQLSEDYGCKISLTHNTMTGADTSIPNNYFNFKVNVASSENVNNALFQQRYNDFLPYDSPAKLRDSRIKNDMEFVPAVLFIRENGNGEHSEFNDNNWHFYALGNLGDSKKTDYTRAYDPDDMNEFTIEISDNNTANSQFQSGVFLSTERYQVLNPDAAELESYEEAEGTVTPHGTIPNAYIGTFIPTTDTVVNSSKTYYYRKEVIETSEMADNPTIDQDPMKYIYPITSEQWNAMQDGEYKNHRHKTLHEQKFDGDNSFEFRYACKGDYRDGDFINDTNGISTVPNTNSETVANKPYLTNDEVQQILNRQVWEAFYEWIVTSTEEQFRNEAAQWFVPKAVEFFYAFTHYYTMMDNRAKNTFWHFAKTGQYRRVSRPVPELFHIYMQSSDAQLGDNGIYTGTFTTATGDFNPNGEYYTQYAFDLWTYDTDTACGIDNNGTLSFPYGKEDTDYRVTGQPASGWAFNGSGSIFWRRLSTTFAEDIAVLMQKEDKDCFSNAEHLIKQFDKFQECFPEELWRRDIERKYIRTFTGNSYDNSITTNKKNTRFLRSMMQGRKKYQRRQWVRNQAVYFGSKYGLSNIHGSDHTIEFSTYTPSTAPGQSALPVPVDQSDLVLVPYQDMYIDVVTGNVTNLDLNRLQRAKAGERVHVDCRSGGSAQETRVYIFGGEYISAIENLAPMYIGQHQFGHGKRLKVLDLGSDVQEYDNPNLTSLVVNANMPLLEILNIKNCKYLTGAPDLSQSNNLRVVEAEGSAITGISLPPYTAIETLHLPATVSNVTLMYARALNDFAIINSSTREEDYSNVTILNITDSDYSNAVNWLDIAKETLNNRINALYLYDLKTSSIGNIDELEDFVTKKHQLEVNYDAQGNLITRLILSGIIHVNGEWSDAEVNTYKSIWSTPELNFNTDNGTYQERYKVTYQYPNGDIIYSTYVDNGGPLVDIWYSSVISEIPTLAPTADTIYRFGFYQQGQYKQYSGWRIIGEGAAENESLDNSSTRTVTRNLVLEAQFTSIPRTYSVRWFLDENKTQLIRSTEQTIPYGGGYDLEAPTILDIHAAGYETAQVSLVNNGVKYDIFNGWEKLPININPDGTTDYYDICANWTHGQDTIENIFADTDNLSPIQLLVLSAITNKSTLNDKVIAGVQMSYTLGCDCSYKNEELIVPSAKTGGKIWTNAVNDNVLATGIKPFSSEYTNGFTLVIDYCFNDNYIYENNPVAAALVSCYSQSNQQAENAEGFVLYDDRRISPGPRIGYGQMFEDSQQAHSINVGSTTTRGTRNILVLRRPKNSTLLHVYSGIVGNTVTTNVTQRTLEWNDHNTDTELIIGAITQSNDSAYTNLKSDVVKAKGTIYWMKFWPIDLGLGECKRLASWPHENMTFAIQNLVNNASSTARAASDSAPTTSITLTTLNGSTHGNITQGVSATSLSIGSIVGWPSSATISQVRELYNHKLILGLPQLLQSIICRKGVSSKITKIVAGGFNGQQFEMQNSPSTSRDYIYALSIADFAYDENGGLNSIYNSELGNKNLQMPWINEANVLYYVLQSGTTVWVDTPQGSQEVLYLMSRFPGIKTPISQLRVFRDPENNNSSYYESISLISGGIKENDIIITVNRELYMYVSSETINTLGLQVMPNDAKFACGPLADGGWVKAIPYWLRSFSDSNTTYTSNFASINYSGVTTVQKLQSTATLGLNYSFSI